MPPDADYEGVIDCLWSIMLECDGHRFGQSRYDITLDHIYDLADQAREIALFPNGSPGGTVMLAVLLLIVVAGVLAAWAVTR